MDIDSAADAIKEEQMEESDLSCRLECTEIVFLSGDADSYCTTECGNGDWSAEVVTENIAIINWEHGDVCMLFYCSI